MEIKGTTQLSESTFIFNNQFFYGEKVGTYLINLPTIVLLFDLPEYNEELKNDLEAFISEKGFVAVLSHGPCGISDGSVWQKELGLKVYMHRADKDSTWLNMRPDVLFEEMPKIDEGVEIIHTPGHTDGSVCLLHQGSKSLFTGDAIYNKNGGLSLDNEVRKRVQGLKTLLEYEFKNIYPFHYESLIGNAKEKLEQFINANS